MLWLAESRTTYRAGEYLLSFDVQSWSLWRYGTNHSSCLARGLATLKAGQALAREHAMKRANANPDA